MTDKKQKAKPKEKVKQGNGEWHRISPNVCKKVHAIMEKEKIKVFSVALEKLVA